MKERFALGLPKGSLNTPGRADTRDLFMRAGYEICGYESGKESDKKLAITNDPDIQPFLIRPQTAPVELSEGMLDAAITGDDWIKEETIYSAESKIDKIGDLKYGKTTLVIAVPDNSDYASLSDFFRKLKERGNPIRCFTEYINLTKRKFMQNEAYQEIYGDMPPVVRIRSIIVGNNDRVKIINSDGLTEAAIRKGADVVTDNTQSGQSLVDNRLKVIEEIMVSSVGLYTGPSCVGWKQEKAQEIFRQLYGAILGKNFFDTKFNVPIGNVEKLRNFLIAEGLCANEPTIVTGENFAQVTILLPKETFPKTVQELIENYGISAIIQSDVKQFIA
jgi:ATP phosphoribosyltransferase